MKHKNVEFTIGKINYPKLNISYTGYPVLCDVEVYYSNRIRRFRVTNVRDNTKSFAGEVYLGPAMAHDDFVRLASLITRKAASHQETV